MIYISHKIKKEQDEQQDRNINTDHTDGSFNMSIFKNMSREEKDEVIRAMRNPNIQEAFLSDKGDPRHGVLGKKEYRLTFGDKRDSLLHIRYFTTKKEALREMRLMKKRKYEYPIELISYDEWKLRKNFRDVTW